MNMNKWIEKYVTDYSSPEDPVLEDLYRQTHIKFVNPNMATGHLQGKFLEFISRMLAPEMILEIGTFTGYSAICLARGLKPDGKLITVEINDELKEFAADYFKKAGLENSISQVTGKAQDVIPGLDEIFDLVYIDGDKREYIDYFNAVFSKVRSGGIILADNILWGEKVLEKYSKDPQTKGIIEFNEMIRARTDIEKVIVPVRDGLMLIRKI
jgi:caffeoyl-CoA O-methyltransferase